MHDENVHREFDTWGLGGPGMKVARGLVESRVTTAEGGQTGGFQSGLRLLSATLLTYAASALFTAASAGLFVTASRVTDRADPLTNLLSALGEALVLIGFALAAASVVLLVVATRRFRQGAFGANPALRRVVPWTENAVFWASVLLSVGMPMMLLSYIFELSPIIYLAGVPICTAGALAFLLAVTLPAVTLASRPDRVMARIAAGIGVIVVVGELILRLSALPGTRGGIGGLPQEPDWLTFGGFPFLNWNLPLGILAAGSSLLLRRAYDEIHARAAEP